VTAATHFGDLAPRVSWWQPVPAARTAPPPERDTVAFRALLVFLFVLLIAPQTTFPALGALRPAMLAAVVAVSACLAGRFLGGEPLEVAAPGRGLAAALGAWAVLTLPLSYWPGGSVEVLSELYLKSLALFWLLANLLSTPRRLRLVAGALIVMGVPLALTGVRDYAAGAFLANASGVTRISGYGSGLAGNPNDLALVLNLLLPLAIAFGLSATTAARRSLAFLAAGVLALGVVVTFSRAGFLTLMATSVLFVIRMLRNGRLAPAAVLAVAGLVAVPLLPAGYVSRIASIASVDSDPTGSAQARWDDTRAALRIVARRPLLGVGLGMNVLALNEERGITWTAVHNVYLQQGVDLGLPGLAVFVALLARSIRSARQVQRAEPASGRQPLLHLGQGIEISLWGFAVSGFFYPVAYHFYFYLIAGLAAAAATLRSPAPAAGARA
jgi:O-antigen ligase